MGRCEKLIAVVKVGLILVAAVFPVALSRGSLDDCPERCGEMDIPYPFGVGERCSLEKKFSLTCYNNSEAYLENGDIQVTDISIERSEIQIQHSVARTCYNKEGMEESDLTLNASLFLPPGMVASHSRNRFFGVGCDGITCLLGDNRKGESQNACCVSFCTDGRPDMESCSGNGCCEIPVPLGLESSTAVIVGSGNFTQDINRCHYAFVVEDGKFDFSWKSSFKDLESKLDLPLIVDWSVENHTCEQVKSEPETYHNCTRSTACVLASNSTGTEFLCHCLPGYHGNPYRPHGCQDIDECGLNKYCKQGICHNTVGNFSCICDKYGFKSNGIECIKDTQRILVYILSGVSVGVVVLACASLLICLVYNNRKLLKQKKRIFEENGGLLLQGRLCNVHGSFDETAKIFTEEELKKATDDFNKNQILGEGGYGVVYKGILREKRVVAIKKSKTGINTQTKQQKEEFINEVTLLMQINHRNVVRLLGCCLDTEVPILVYEFITNGTLFEHIHKKGLFGDSPLSWDQRLKIATGTACALAYLHSETNTPILHRDIKSMNILLDEKYNAKVADFGASRLVPTDQEELSTLVQGTFGYLDPEYLQSSQLTDKSDVYSFGVVLAELLTGKRALSSNKSEGTTTTLANVFMSWKEEERFVGVIDEEIDCEVNADAIKEVVRVAKSCLRIKGEERPTMKEVAMELEGISVMSMHVPKKVELPNGEDNAYLFGSSSNDGFGYDPEAGYSVASSSLYDSIQNEPIMKPYNDGR